MISAALSSILLIHSTVSSNILLIPLSVFYWEGNGIPLQYSCLENPMDRGAWWAAVHGIAKSRTWLSDFTFTFHFYALGKKMATHSSVLAWRLPGTGEPGGLPSMGSHRVGHDWSDLAATAVYFKFQLLYSSILLGSSSDFLTLCFYIDQLFVIYVAIIFSKLLSVFWFRLRLIFEI